MIRYPCLQYIIEGSGKRIYHAGDTLRYEGMLPRLLEPVVLSAPAPETVERNGSHVPANI